MLTAMNYHDYGYRVVESKIRQQAVAFSPALKG